MGNQALLSVGHRIATTSEGMDFEFEKDVFGELILRIIYAFDLINSPRG